MLFKSTCGYLPECGFWGQLSVHSEVVSLAFCIFILNRVLFIKINIFYDLFAGVCPRQSMARTHRSVYEGIIVGLPSIGLVESEFVVKKRHFCTRSFM